MPDRTLLVQREVERAAERHVPASEAAVGLVDRQTSLCCLGVQRNQRFCKSWQTVTCLPRGETHTSKT
eukprot:884394-Prymnesium_polylepis.2